MFKHTLNTASDRIRISISPYFMGIAAIFLLFACATSNSAPLKPTQTSLALCQGVKVSNPPPTNPKGLLTNFQPTLTIRGKILSTTPVTGCLSSGYGKRSGGAGNIHKGIDLFTDKPEETYAAGSGKISFIGWQSGYGRLIEIDHGKGIRTRYAHLSKFSKNLKLNSGISKGAVIGYTGESGNATAIHLHYELLIDNKTTNPLKF